METVDNKQLLLDAFENFEFLTEEELDNLDFLELMFYMQTLNKLDEDYKIIEGMEL